MGLPAVPAHELTNVIRQLQLFVEDQDIHGLCLPNSYATHMPWPEVMLIDT